MVTQQRLKELFEYDSATGNLIWKENRHGRSNKSGGALVKGKVAGCLTKKGYVRIWVDNKGYPGHRLIFLFHHGFLPEQVDHVNRVKTDNRIENLRQASPSENSRNKGSERNSTSKYKGVHWNKQNAKWIATLWMNNKNTYLGIFSEEGDAAMAYNEVALQYYRDFAVLNDSPLNHTPEVELLSA